MKYDPYWDKVVLALPFEGPAGSTTIQDLKGHPILVTSAFLSVTQKKLGTSSLYKDTYDLIRTDAHSDFEFGVGDFTLEAWVYPIAPGRTDSNSNSVGIIIAKTGSSAGNNVMVFSMHNDTLRFATTNNFQVSSYTLLGGWVLNKWYHLAATREGGVLRLFIDGAKVLEEVHSGDLNGMQTVWVGGRSYTGDYTWDFSGYMDDVRITKGVARYTKSFTPDNYQMPEIFGSGVLQGQTLEAGIPVPRVVRVYHRNTLELLQEITTDSNGQFAFDPRDSGPFFIVGLDDPSGTKYNAIVFDHITPVRA